MSYPAAAKRGQLLEAVISENIELLKQAIHNGADINERDKDGKTALHLACERGNTDAVQILVANGADLHSKDKDSRTPLHLACESGSTDIIETLVSAGAYLNSKDKNGCTPLHVTCQNGHVFAVAALLSYPVIDPVARNNRNQTPMELVPPDHSNQTVILQLFERFEQCRTTIPVDSYVKVFMCGDTTAGKSSLTQVIHNRANKSSDHVYDPDEVVTNVQELTAGIEPHTIVSREAGHLILYDFSGHREYYSSHAAITENLMLQSPGVFNILVRLDQDESIIEMSILYWLNFIMNVCAKLHKEAQVIVVGSRFDLLTTDATEYRLLIDGIIARSKLRNFAYRGFVAVDCHRPGGKGVREFMELLSQCCKDVIDRSDSISYYCHVLCSFLHDLQEVAVTVSDLCDKLKAHNHPSLPSEQDRVLEHLTVLSDRGFIVFLPNEDPSKRWIVIKKEVLLAKVIGVLFAPEDIDRVHLEISSNTGIISVAALKEAFPQYDLEMLIGFLTCLQFCHEIDAEFLNSIDTNVTPNMKIECGQLLFFPSLIAVECPAEITINASFGWCLYCSDPNRFLSTRFLHVLLLLLSHKYSLLKKSGVGEIRKAIPQDIQQHERQCTVWKNGIYWKRDNTEVLVEVSNYNRCVTVLLTGKNATKMLSSVIQRIRYLQNTLCPCNSVEYVIAPDTLASVRTTDVNDMTVFPVQSIAKATFLNQHEVCNETGETVNSLEVLVREEEPFITLPPYTIQQLFNGDPSEYLPKDLLQQLYYSCPLVMKSYTDQDDATYQSAIWHLQKFTLFPEGSPLVYAESDMDEEEKETLHVLINSPTCCRGRRPRLCDLMRFLTDEAYRWNEIGVHLDVPSGVRSSLDTSNKSLETRLSVVFQYWLQHGTNHGTISPTWEIIVVLAENSLDNKHLHKEILQFLGEDTSNCSSPVAVTPEMPHVKSDTVSTDEATFTAQTVGTSSPSLTDQELRSCSRHLVDNLEDIAGFLEISEECFESIQVQDSKSKILQGYKVLKKWQEGNPESTRQQLIDVLKSLGLTEAVESLSSSSTIVVRQPKKHDVVQFLLSSPADDQWEKIGSILEVSLEIIGNLKISSSSDSEKLIAVINSWVPTPVTWDKLLNKSTMDREGLALEVLKLFEPDDVRSKSNVSVLSIILIDVLKETPWKDLGTALSIEEDDLKEIHESDPFKCQMAVISLWLQKCRANRTDREFLIKALESAFYRPKKHDVVVFLLSPTDDYQWEEIGSVLEVSSEVIESLKTSFSSDFIKLSAVIENWVPTPVTWEKLLSKSKRNGDGLTLKVLKLFQPDDVKKEDAIPVLSVILNDVLKETPWKDLGTALSIEEDDLKKIHEKNPFKCQMDVISLWLQKCGASKTTEETLFKALESLKSNESSLKKIDRDYLKKAFKSGRVKAKVSKAIIQGPARAGKTSLRCLITNKRYESKTSTGCIETPCVAIHKDKSVTIHKYGSYDGTCWKFVSDDEMLTEAVRISKHYEDEEMKKTEQEPKSSPLMQATTDAPDTTTDTTTSISTGANASVTGTLVPKSHQQHTDSSISKDSPKKPAMQPKIDLPQNLAHDIMQKAKKEMQNILDSVADDPEKALHKKWLYFIDSGGQIQFQRLLHAFLPCASVLLLVTNLAEGFSDQSSTEMQLDDGAQSVSEYSPTNEVLLEQLIIMVDACSEQQREIIRRDPYLSEIIKPPDELQVMAIATHLDEFEELLKEGKVAETIENKQKKFNQLLRSLKDALICPNLCNSEFFYIIDGRKAMEEGGSRDTVVNKICEELHNQAFEIDIPLRWYAFEILLRKTAEPFHGVLTLKVCKNIGRKELQMKDREVESALKFFHLLNTMLYYPESEAKDLIFAHPRHLFDVITELAILICRIRNKEGPQGVKTRTIEYADMGIVSKEFIAISETSKKILCNISDFGSKLLSLFDYLKIAKTVPAAEYGEERFFMPALLPLIDPSTESQSADCPFVFHFKKSAPIGLFCTFIIYLLSSHKKEEDADWSIPPLSTRISSNYIILRGGRLGMGDVRFLEHRDRYEVYCDKAEHRIALRKHLTEAMKQLVKEKDIGFEKWPKPALYCPCDQISVPHTATIRTEDVALLCTVDEILVKCAPNNTHHACWSWLFSTSTAATDKGMSTFSQALLQCRLNEEPELSVLVDKLSSIDYQWRELGTALKVEKRHLQALSMNMQYSNIVKLERVMTYWRDGLKLPYKWITILDIISGATIGNQRLRKEIEQFLGTEEVTAESSSYTGPPTQSNDVNPSTGATEKAGDAPAVHDDTGRKIKAHSKQDTEMSDPGAPVQEEDSTHTERLHEQTEKKEPDLEQQKEETEELKKETGEQQKITSREQTYTQVVQEKPAPDDMPGPAQPTMTILEQNKALLKDYTADQIGEYLLVKMGLDQYKETFKEMGINGVTFFDLTYDFLKDPEEFNVKSKFHQKLVMNIVNGVTPVTNYI